MTNLSYIPLCYPLYMISDKLFHDLFQLGYMLYVDRPLGIVESAIIKYQLCVVQEGLEVWVLVRVQLVFHGAEICKDGQAYLEIIGFGGD